MTAETGDTAELDQRLARAASADVLDRVRVLLEITHQTRTLPSPVEKALIRAYREFGVRS